MQPLQWVAAVAALVLVLGLVWRWASRRWPLPCPSLFGWALESRFYQWFSGAGITVDRLPLRPGLRILEIGPGPGRILLPAAQRVLPGGEAVGIDIQPGMVARLQTRAREAGLTNLSALSGDATQPLVPPGSFDLVFLVTTLGEIPDRAAALRESFRALKPGGMLSVTELFGDPHYQSRATVRRLAEEAGFRLAAVEGNWRLFTANFVKPADRSLEGASQDML